VLHAFKTMTPHPHLPFFFPNDRACQLSMTQDPPPLSRLFPPKFSPGTRGFPPGRVPFFLTSWVLAFPSSPAFLFATSTAGQSLPKILLTRIIWYFFFSLNNPPSLDPWSLPNARPPLSCHPQLFFPVLSWFFSPQHIRWRGTFHSSFIHPATLFSGPLLLLYF